MGIAKGVLLGPYEILNRIGTGGMGEVWRARDQRIGRDVAIKVLPESFTAGDELVQRFEQEARAAGALNHPGLVTIFDVGTTNGAPYIVMELLEGQTLRDALDAVAPAPMPLRKAIDYAMQIASALSVAHEKGIIHRDLKPENIIITADDRVKILDFGLAKLAADATDVEGRRRTARHLTSAGIVVGTPGYMSPEQVRAHPLDHRTDIFALGVVLYEMLAGRPAFDCESAVETMHAVLSFEPPSPIVFSPATPPALDTIVQHCMEKNPRERFQSARDLAFQLRMVAEAQTGSTGVRTLAPETTTAAARKARKRWLYRSAIAAVALLAVGAGGFAIMRVRNGEPPEAARAFRQLTFGDGVETFPTLAPDGKSFAYVSSQSGNRDIYVQRVDGRTATNVTADSPDDDSQPAISPDGSQLAFRSERDGGGIFVMGVTGESVRRLTEFGYNPAWSPDGRRIVFSTAAIDLRPHVRPANGELWIVDTRTEAKRALVQAGQGGPEFGRDSDAVQPSWSPHGHRIAFWGLSDWEGRRDIWTIDPDAPEPKRTVVRVTSDPTLHWNPVWSPDGRYLYFGSDREGTLNLWRIAMDEASGKPAGAEEPLSLPAPVSGSFAVSREGDLAYATVTRSYRLLAIPFDATAGTVGAPRTLLSGSQEILSFDPSPDGQSIAFTTGSGQEDVFIANADGTRMRQLTNDAARDRSVTWSPDGKRLYFYSNRDSGYHIWSIRADGSGLTRVTDAADLKRHGGRNIFSPAVSPDGKTLAVQTDKSNALVHLDRPLPQRLEPIEESLEAPKWSPDGTRLVGAIVNHRAAGLHQRIPAGGGMAVYALPTGQSKTLASSGRSPHWLPDGKRIAFFERDRIGVVDADSGRVTTIAFPPLPGVSVEDSAVAPRLSIDGSTLYVRQTIEEGDVWLLRPGKE